MPCLAVISLRETLVKRCYNIFKGKVNRKITHCDMFMYFFSMQFVHSRPQSKYSSAVWVVFFFFLFIVFSFFFQREALPLFCNRKAQSRLPVETNSSATEASSLPGNIDKINLWFSSQTVVAVNRAATKAARLQNIKQHQLG